MMCLTEASANGQVLQNQEHAGILYWADIEHLRPVNLATLIDYVVVTPSLFL
jgi:hypothetical protein